MDMLFQKTAVLARGVRVTTPVKTAHKEFKHTNQTLLYIYSVMLELAFQIKDNCIYRGVFTPWSSGIEIILGKRVLQVDIL